MADCPGACVRTPLAVVRAGEPDQAECATTHLPGCPRGRPRRTNAILFSKAAPFRSSALFDVAGPSPHCHLTSCRPPPTPHPTRHVGFSQTKTTPHFPTRMSRSRLLSLAGTSRKRRTTVCSDSARPAIANQRHGNGAQGSAGPHSADLARFVIPVRPDPNYDIAFFFKKNGPVLAAQPLLASR